MIVRNALAALGLLAIVGVSAVGLSASGLFEGDAPPRLAVSFRGLDLTTPEGLDLLDERIDGAIATVCHAFDATDLDDRRLVKRCRAKALAGVRPQIERAIDQQRRQRFDPDRPPSLFDDVAGQSRIIAKAIRTSIGYAFADGITDNWYTLGAKGLVFAGPAYVYRNETCRFMTVTHKVHGQQEVLTRGAVCRSPYGALES